MSTELLHEKIKGNGFVRYSLALASLAIALLVGRVLGPFLGTYVIYGAVFPAIAFCAWYCGAGPSALSASLATVALKYWFMIPVQSLSITARQVLGLLVFLVACGLIIAMAEVHRAENIKLRGAQGELETRVKQRTAELDRANQELRELTACLMQSQDDERRRIARELHDSIGQTLAALTMNLTAVGSDIDRLTQTAAKVVDSTALVQQMNKEVRTISYLLHPPLLDEAGLVSALRWYAEGFSERSKIQVELEVPEDFGRLARELETAIFRTAQECLTNIHRHSGSSVARLFLAQSAGVIRLRVEDRGSGVPAEKLDQLTSNGTHGVGIRGMRERLQQLGGQLLVHSDENGTTVEACLPVASSKEVTASVIAA